MFQKTEQQKREGEGEGKYSSLSRQCFGTHKRGKGNIILAGISDNIFSLATSAMEELKRDHPTGRYPIQSNYYAIRDPCIRFRLGRSEFLSRDINLSEAASEESKRICTRPIGMENLNYIQVKR